jgi:hypothetical protein
LLPSWLAALLIGGASGVVLNIFYMTVKHVWPENYFGLDGSVDPVVSRNIARYLVFRFVPPAVMIGVAALTSERLGGDALLAALAALLVHIARLVVDAAKKGRSKLWGQVRNRLILIVLLATVAYAAYAIRSILAPIVPLPSELVANLWAGILAAIGAVYLQKVVLVRKNPAEVISASFDEVSVDIARYAVSASVSLGLDPKIVLALMCAENVQRPRWFRRLERLLPPDTRTGGIMQQVGAVDDRHSVDLALNRFIAAWGQPEIDYDGNTDEYWLEKQALDYNHNYEFAHLASLALRILNQDSELFAKFMTC